MKIVAYNEILDYITSSSEEETYWKFKRIVAHQGPLDPKHPDYMGSKYNVMVEWESGETTTEPLSTFAADAPVVCALYAKDNKLLNQEG